MYYIDTRTLSANGVILDHDEDRENGYVTLFAARAVFKQLASIYGIIHPFLILPNEWYTSGVYMRSGIKEQMRIIEIK